MYKLKLIFFDRENLVNIVLIKLICQSLYYISQLKHYADICRVQMLFYLPCYNLCDTNIIHLDDRIIP